MDTTASEIDKLIEEIENFVRERNWERYHRPKNLAISISIEAGELLEHFQWEDKEKEEFTPDEIKEISYEIADVFIYLLHLCTKLGIDIIGASFEKLKKNREKYPVEKFYGHYERPEGGS